MKKLFLLGLLFIAPSLFAEKIYLMDLYTLIPVEDDESSWEEASDDDNFTIVEDYVEAELWERELHIEFHAPISNAFINIVDQATGDVVVESVYSSCFITIPLTTTLPGTYLIEIYTGERALGGRFELE